MNVESLGRLLAAYFDYVIEFTTHPRAALAARRNGAHVSPDLAQQLLVAIALAIGLGVATKALAPATPSLTDELAGTTVATIRRLGNIQGTLDPVALPFLNAAVIFLAAVCAHAVLRSLALLSRAGAPDKYSSSAFAGFGSVHCTVNAMLGFSAAYLPVVSLAALLFTVETRGLPVALGIALGVLLSIALFFAPFAYVTAALSGAHPGLKVSNVLAMYWFGGGIATVVIGIWTMPWWMWALVGGLVALGAIVSLVRGLARRLRARSTRAQLPAPE